jgi:multiple sugar transport system ATP-binding protein
MASVRVEQMSKLFGRVGALNGVSCTFEDGQFTVLVGPSGCGKTTLLRLIAGLEEPSGGEMYIGDENVAGAPPWERNLAMVFQSYALYPHMTVFKNIAFPLRATKCSQKEIQQRVHETARILQIEELLERKPRELSGGQMQRVALGRSIVRKPAVFLMDEPLSNLDAKLRVAMRAELKHLQQQLGVTTIYVTHDQAEAMTLGDQLIVMNAGRIQQIGKPEDVYRYPCNEFVAGFIGSPPMNFLKCGYEAAKHALASDAFAFEVGPHAGELLAAGDSKALTLGVRPEDLVISLAPSPNAIAATVYVTEQLGREILVNASVGQEIIRGFASPDTQLKTDEAVWLSFKETAIHVFDQKTGETLYSGSLGGRPR